jgi:nicotinate-nucleotide pyrophosphorylase (carboxylating)
MPLPRGRFTRTSPSGESSFFCAVHLLSYGRMNWKSPALRTLIKLSIKEDAARQDITTRTLIPAGLKIEAQIRAKQNGIACGLPMAVLCFHALDTRLQFVAKVREGQRIKTGQLMASLRGQARSILSAERTALNAVQHLSGIATYTREQVDRLNGGQARIYDTRKTLPGWRDLEKYAVACGGGKNHRRSLSDGALIKENHLHIARAVRRDWLKRAKTLKTRMPVEMEIQTWRDLVEAFELAPDQLLLDNMDLKTLRKLVQDIRRQLPRVAIEVSGGIRPDQLKALSRLPIDRISMGRLTHSAPAFDCALDITHVFHPR